MLNTIEEAAKNFCIHQIREDYEISEIKELAQDERTLVAYIDIETEDGTKYRVYIASDSGFIQKVAQLFLEEEESDEETLQDMMLETVNLIVGSAKVIAQESETPYSIETPHFEKVGSLDVDFDKAFALHVGDEKMIIAIKELDAKSN